MAVDIFLFRCFCMLIFFNFCYGQNETFRSAQIGMVQTFFKLQIDGNRNISKECKSVLNEAFSSVPPKWAYPMLDAMGKIPAGIFQMSMSFVGSYDQCLDIVISEANEKLVQGQYCIISFNPKHLADGYAGMGQIVNVNWHTCIPSTCTESDAAAIGRALLNIPIGTDISAICEVKEKVSLTTEQIIAIVIFSTLGAFLLIGTVLDIVLIVRRKFQTPTESSQHGRAVRTFLSFSLYTNASKMLNTKTSSGNLTAINGIRFLSMTWIIIAHTYSAVNFLFLGNMIQMSEYFKDFAFQVVANGTVSVDVFFFLSGLLLAYVSLRELKKNGRINWFLFYFHRIWRLTPALGLVILSTFLMPLFGSGPLWKYSWDEATTGCKEKWWTVMLYVNNLVKDSMTCVGHTWYLANDMQFYIVSPIIIYLLWREVVSGLMMNTAFLMATTLTPALLVMKYEYLPTLLPLNDQQKLQDFMFNVYIKPWCRMSAYCVGIYIGFLLTRKKILKIHPIVQIVLWCLSIAGCMAVVYGTYEWNRGNPSSVEINALYVATHRTAFALGIAWMTYACCTGYGGIINRILSWKVFIPLGRLTYMAYLYHPYIMILLNISQRERLIVSHYYMVVTGLGFLVVSYAVAFVTSIAFETPFINLEKVIFSRPSQQSSVQKTTPDDVMGEMKEISVVYGGNDNSAFVSEKF